MINDDTIKRIQLDNKVPVYTICTSERIYVMMENVPVCTWKKDEWEQYSKDLKIIWKKQ